MSRKRNDTTEKTSKASIEATVPTPRETTVDILSKLDEFESLIPESLITIAGYTGGAVQIEEAEEK